MTPNSVYNLLCGFFFTPKISKQKVVYEIFFLKSRFPYFQLWMRDVSLLHSQTCWADETLVLGRLTGESITNISHLHNKKQKNAIYLCNHSFPLILLSLTRWQHSEHLTIGNGRHLGNRNRPLSSLLLSLLLHSVGQDLRTRNALTIQQIGGKSSFGGGINVGVLVGSLLMHLDPSFEHDPTWTTKQHTPYASMPSPCISPCCRSWPSDLWAFWLSQTLCGFLLLISYDYTAIRGQEGAGTYVFSAWSRRTPCLFWANSICSFCGYYSIITNPFSYIPLSYAICERNKRVLTRKDQNSCRIRRFFNYWISGQQNS